MNFVEISTLYLQGDCLSPLESIDELLGLYF